MCSRFYNEHLYMYAQENEKEDWVHCTNYIVIHRQSQKLPQGLCFCHLQLYMQCQPIMCSIRIVSPSDPSQLGMCTSNTCLASLLLLIINSSKEAFTVQNRHHKCDLGNKDNSVLTRKQLQTILDCNNNYIILILPRVHNS